jgi:hypothetical protein
MGVLAIEKKMYALLNLSGAPGAFLYLTLRFLDAILQNGCKYNNTVEEDLVAQTPPSFHAVRGSVMREKAKKCGFSDKQAR